MVVMRDHPTTPMAAFHRVLCRTLLSGIWGRLNYTQGFRLMHTVHRGCTAGTP
jgi:hypothetical protein